MKEREEKAVIRGEDLTSEHMIRRNSKYLGYTAGVTAKSGIRRVD